MSERPVPPLRLPAATPTDAAEPDVARVAHGVPRRLVRDAIHAYGNAVVPQVGEHIGRIIAGEVVPTR